MRNVYADNEVAVSIFVWTSRRKQRKAKQIVSLEWCPSVEDGRLVLSQGVPEGVVGGAGQVGGERARRKECKWRREEGQAAVDCSTQEVVVSIAPECVQVTGSTTTK